MRRRGFIAHDSTGDNDGFVIVQDPLWRAKDGKMNGALELDGIDDCVSTKSVLNPPQGPFSVFMQVKGGLPGEVFLSQKNGTDWLHTFPPKGLLMTILGQSGPLLAQVVITDGQWHRIGFTWDGTNRTLYVDDVEAAKGADMGLRKTTDRGKRILS